ncbi:MAG: D-alanine--D-alanine ligase, partial [Chlorobiaceae bacterium]|nr:D-alanine--D-alanine ligase [Chlorobiaceae bacterium]
MSRQTVALFFGGKSAEHEISIISARAVADHINRDEYEIAPVYIDRTGLWHGGVCAESVLSLDVSALLRSGSPEAAARHIDDLLLSESCQRFDFNAFLDRTDVAFLVLHGSYGEDGRLQGCLDTFGIPYTGCGLTASALAMDKALTKLCAFDAGIEVAEYVTVMSGNYVANKHQIINEITGRFTWPVFVKPANLGSSVGISKVRNEEELTLALET